MKQVLVYSKQGCPFCSLLKAELVRRRITFTEFDLSDDSIRAKFYENTGTASVPQVYVTDSGASLDKPNGESFGGYTDISRDWNRFENSLL